MQLQVQHPDLGGLVADSYKSSAARVANNFDELGSLFEAMCKKISTICVIEGLDEYQERDEYGTLDRSTFAHHLAKLPKGHRSDSVDDSPCGFFLYGGLIGRDDYNLDEHKIKFFKLDLTSFPVQPISYIKAISPIKEPSNCGLPNPAFCAVILKDEKPHFLIIVEYKDKVMLAKIDFDGTVKRKVIAHLPGLLTSPEAIALSGWNRDWEGGRLDIVLATQNVAHASMVNTWDENPGKWDDVCRVNHDPSFQTLEMRVPTRKFCNAKESRLREKCEPPVRGYRKVINDLH